MGAVTYPDPEVGRFIEEHFVPVQYNVVEHPEVFDRFNASWTPTIILQDADGREHRRSEGYLDPRRFVAELALGRVNAALHRKDLKQASELAREARQKAQGDPEREPEALYWASVADYQSSHDGAVLTKGFNELLDRHPNSEWAKRVEFVRNPG